MKKFIENILHPIKVFIAILVVALIWFVPIAFPPNTAEQTPLQQSLPVLKLFASSADACPFACVKCTAWDPDAWPKNCLEYVCLADCEEELPPPTQPPTISHVLTCTSNGNNGWCKGNLSLDLTASDPQNAQVIISGTINGIPFVCPTGNKTCSVPLNDGQGNITYRVDSSTGLSDSDTTTYKKDSTTPQINGNVTGANGLNPSTGSGQSNWYVSLAILSASSTDTTSGISTFEMNLNNTGWVTYAETTFTDGINTIQYRATDNAGNVTETAIQEIKVDTVTPVIDISTTGTLGLNNWYVSNVTMNANSSDVTSGIASFEINLNNTGWTTFDLQPVTFTDGIHSIQYRAIDNAGNTYTTTLQEIKIDTTTPSLSLSTIGTKGQNDWYTSQTSVTPIATDVDSGIASIEYKLNNGSFNLYTSPLQFTDGINNYQFQITDNAGNITTTPSITLKVDTIAPVVDMDDEIDLGDTLYYALQDNGSGLWINRTVIEDEDEKYKKVVWLEEISGYKIESDILWDGKFADKTSAPVGEYFITLKIADQAGNETFRTAIVNVNPLSFLQVIPPFTPPTTNEEGTNQLDNQPTSELTFGNENNGNSSNETSSTNVGGETVFANTIAQAGTLTSFTSGNENTSTPITNTDILWGAMATAIVGATLAEWQRKREEEQARQRELDRIAQMEKNARKREEQARLDYLNAAYQAKLDREKEKQIAVSAARWNGIAKIEEAKQEAKKIASQNTFNHLMNEHKSQTGVYVSKPNTSGSKPLLKPVTQEENPFAGLSASGGSVTKTVGETLLTNAEKLGLDYSPEMLTYMIASINIQSKGSNTTQDGDNAHLGYAQLSRNELDTPYGEGFDCKNGECRGYGLGLPGRNPYDNDTAVLGMNNRIQQVLDKAENLGEKNDIVLTSTDEYIMIAMAQNGPGFDLNDIQIVMNPTNGFIQDGTINWEAYFDSKQISYNNKLDSSSWFNPNDWQFLVNNIRTGGADYDTKFMLEEFYDETSQLEEKGYALPEDLEAERVEELINRPLTGTEGGQ